MFQYRRSCMRLLTLSRLYIGCMVMLVCNANVFSQTEGGRVGFGVNAGGVKYWGTFTDNQLWFSGDMFVRWNIIDQLSLQASVGFGQLRYKNTEKSLVENPNFYSLFPSDKQPQEKNFSRFNYYETYLSWNILPKEKFVPYVFGGVGVLDWNPTYQDGSALPLNDGKTYDKRKVVIPVGLGYELYLTDDLVFNGRGTLRLTGSGWIDGYDARVKELNEKPVAKVDNPDDADDLLLTFGIGFSYYVFGNADYDKDGLTNSTERELGTDPENPDTDGDGLTDGDEVRKYYTDPKKSDTDGDNLTDYAEIFDHKTSPKSPDTDGDGLNDGEEITRKTNPQQADTDGDGLIDGDEVSKHKTDPTKADTDGDTLSDGQEVMKLSTNPLATDTDGDRLSDGDEVNTYKTNPAKQDTDNDSLNDGDEVKQFKTDPTNPDSDGDELSDGDEVKTHNTNPLKTDTDGDGLNDGEEVRKLKTNPVSDDSDNDSVKDGDEVNVHKTNPNKEDTDEDGLKDGDELTRKTNPLDTDSDKDRLRDGEEVNKYFCDPTKPDTDGDSLTDYEEVNRRSKKDGTTIEPTDPTKADTDGDTFNDAEDMCPLIAGKANESDPTMKGCPELPKKGTKTDFPEILFVKGKDAFNFDNPSTMASLAKLLAYVNQCDNIQVTIEGHASEEGNPTLNLKLSQQRAEAVRKWLVEQGVNPAKVLGAIGYGSTRPTVKEPKGKDAKKITPAQLEEIRRKNRRITVAVERGCD